MAEGSHRGLRGILARAWAYELLQIVVGANRSHARFVAEYVRPQYGDRILDLGCGPGHILRSLPPETEYVGIDSSPDYVDSARKEWGDRAAFRIGDVRDPLGSEEPFDIVLVMGVLHHLDDAGCRDVLLNGASVLRPAGRLVAIEPARVAQESRASRLLISIDRGSNVRTLEGYAGHARGAFGSVEAEVRTDLLRVPYAHAVLSCSEPAPRGDASGGSADSAESSYRPGGARRYAV
jgi:SAM-dependent methyltransferase